VIASPQTGYNAGTAFTPGATYQLRLWSTDAVVYSGTPTEWNVGAVQGQSGDKVWWFDFSSVTALGEYYIFDVTNNVGSYKFAIDGCVYAEPLKQAIRMFYYQRCGCPKNTAQAGAGWADGACHIRPLQDTDCRLYNNNDPSTSRDLSGGWHDAGDYNKYVNFTFSTVMDLLLAYQENPTAFTDDLNIPESGNGTPDLLDEVKYELDWLLKMQENNGSLLSVIGGGAASPPSDDNTARVYGPATTSATYTGAALFALGAIVFDNIGNTAYGSILENAAMNAWNWAENHPSVTFYNTGVLAAGENETNGDGLFTRRIASSVFLYALTGNTTFQTVVDNNYSSAHLIAWSYVYPFENEMQDVLLYYANLSTTNASIRNDINNAYINSVQNFNNDNLPAYLSKTDAYRAWMSDNNYTWNSNKTKACQGNIFRNMLTYAFNSANATNYSNAALGFVNYFHGVNPNTKVYLSNMNGHGAENSVSQFYHSWFENGSTEWDEVGVSTYGPPAGFIPGGPNPGYALDGCCPGGCGSAQNNALCNTNVTPPFGQPIQKSYKDFNDSWPVNSWTVTEAGIYTNASYVRLVSKYVGGGGCLVNAISSIRELNFRIYPNPTAGEILISMKGDLSGLEVLVVMDMTGRKMLERKLTKEEEISVRLDVKELKSGVYFIQIKGKNASLERRFVKL
jgi:hypothetical protein